MGEAARKKKNTTSFLSVHKWCVYCGAAAETTDHCPPRCFFIGRQWPETYEFPACKACNEEARLDEQALAVLMRTQASDFSTGAARAEWERLLQGVTNNQPDLIREWTNISGTHKKRFFREAFGVRGDLMRYQGWGAVTIGPLTREAIDRFMVKLTKALYYKHSDRIFDGILYARHINIVSEKDPNATLKSLFELAPVLSETKRNGKELSEQFAYRYNPGADQGAFYVAVRLSPQFIFQLVALSFDMAERLESIDSNRDHLSGIRFECRLKHKIGTTTEPLEPRSL
jgi:hypothetical protein